MSQKNSAESIIKIKTILGEGSLWEPSQQVLYWLDIEDQKVFVYNPANGENKTLEVPDYPSTVVPRESGGAVICLRNGFASLNLEDGSTEMLAELDDYNPATRLNDGKCDPAGRLWAGTMDFDLTNPIGGLYFLDRDLSVKKVLSDITCSNGIVWTQNNNSMYYIDSLTHEVQGFDYEIETGDISRRRVVVSVPEKLGFPDGMAIDEEDMLWVAIYDGGVVNRYNPKNGNLLETIQVPGARSVTSCAFGGPDLQDLYITTSSWNYEEDDWKNNPNAGNLFKVELDVKGVPAVKFKD